MTDLCFYCDTPAIDYCTLCDAPCCEDHLLPSSECSRGPSHDDEPLHLPPSDYYDSQSVIDFDHMRMCNQEKDN